MSSQIIDTSAAAIVSLVLSARTLSKLTEKNVLSGAEAATILRATYDQIAIDDPSMRANAQHAMKTVFPTFNFDA